jgi:hypothetical protein
MSPTSSRNPDLSSSPDDGAIEAEEHNKVFGIDLAKLTPTSRLLVCVGGTFAFYLIYGYLQVRLARKYTPAFFALKQGVSFPDVVPLLCGRSYIFEVHFLRNVTTSLGLTFCGFFF